MAVDHSIAPTRGERFLPLARGLQLLGVLLDAPPRAAPAAALDVDWGEHPRHARAHTRVNCTR